MGRDSPDSNFLSHPTIPPGAPSPAVEELRAQHHIVRYAPNRCSCGRMWTTTDRLLGHAYQENLSLLGAQLAKVAELERERDQLRRFVHELSDAAKEKPQPDLGAMTILARRAAAAEERLAQAVDLLRELQRRTHVVPGCDCGVCQFLGEET